MHRCRHHMHHRQLAQCPQCATFLHKPYKKRVRMPSMLDPHVEEIDRWLAAEPRLTALAILDRLAARCPGQFGPPQHTIVQRLLKDLRTKAAGRLIAGAGAVAATTARPSGTAISSRSEAPPLLPPAPQATARSATALGNIVS
jgi:hypothetical protein